MSFDDFFNLFAGTGTNFDIVSGNQCEGLVNYWSRAIGGPRFTGQYAYQIFDQPGAFYEQITNTPEGFPGKGDIVVFTSSFNNGAGHTGIATGIGDTNSFEIFESNDPLGSGAKKKTYTYEHVVGWLHPKQITDNLAVCLAQHTDLVNKCNEKDAQIESLSNQLIAANNHISNLQVDSMKLQNNNDSSTLSDPTIDIKSQYPTLHTLFSEFISLLHHNK